MQTTKKKPNILLIVLGAVLASYLGYLVAGAWREGIEFNAFLERFEMVCAYPLKDYFNEYTFRMIGYALVAYAIGVVMYFIPVSEIICPERNLVLPNWQM